jgi:hypothetical protein
VSNWTVIWGLHPYRDIATSTTLRDRDNRSRPLDAPRSGTKLFSRLVGRNRQIWFSEIGSRIDTRSGSPKRGTGRKPLSRQADDVRYLLDTLARTGGRIRRLYYHSLCEGPGLAANQPDGALLGGDPPTRSG